MMTTSVMMTAMMRGCTVVTAVTVAAAVATNVGDVAALAAVSPQPTYACLNTNKIARRPARQPQYPGSVYNCHNVRSQRTWCEQHQYNHNSTPAT